MSPLMSRALFALGGLAAGVLSALGVTAVIDKPSTLLTEAQAKLEAVTEERNDFSRQAGKLAESEAKLIDRVEELEELLERLEKSSEKVAVTAAAAIASANREFPNLRRCRAFKMVVDLKGELAEVLEEERGRFEKTLAERIEGIGVPLVDSVTSPDEAVLVIVIRTTPGRRHIGGMLSLTVAVKPNEDDVVFLTADSVAFVADDFGGLAKEVMLALDSVALAFKSEWQKARAGG